MTKKEFIEVYKEKGGFSSKLKAQKSIDAFLESLETILKQGEEISFLGFGKFHVSERAARTGRNPYTGKEIKIGAKKNVRFKVGKKLSEKING